MCTVYHAKCHLHIAAEEEELGDELLDEDNLEESYEGDKKPDTTASETTKKVLIVTTVALISFLHLR